MRSWLLLLLLPASPVRADPPLGDWVGAYDTLGELRPRAGEPTDLRSGWGTRVDASCFPAASEGEREALRDRFHAVVTRALTEVRACDARYQASNGTPLIPFLPDLVSVLRRMTLVCVSREADPEHFGEGSDTGAYTRRRRLPGGIPSPRVRREAERELPRQLWGLVGPRAPASFSGTYFMVLPDTLEAFLSREELNRAGFLFHEAMHYTAGGNRADHNRVERIAYDRSDPCALNRLDDRVRFFEAVCGFEPGYASELLHRLEACGLRRACVQPLTTHVPEGSQTLRLDSLDAEREHGRHWTDHPREAELFCRRLSGDFGRRARSRQVLDGRAVSRWELVRSLLWQQGGGLDRSIPAYYMAALTPEERAQVAANPAWVEGVERSCGGMVDRTPFKEADGSRGLVRWRDGTVLPPDCPLGLGPGGSGPMTRLLEFHNIEARLQEASLDAVAAMRTWLESGRGSLDDVERDVIVLYQDACRLGPRDFHPRLCENGESALLSAIAELRARLVSR